MVRNMLLKRAIGRAGATAYFEALSDMFTYDGILFYLPQGVVIEEPIHVVIISSSNNYDTIDTPRLLIALDKNAQASITVSLCIFYC